MKINIKKLLFAFALACLSIQAQAQIGYQVSLLNTATGEPRANVTVNAQVTITDSQDNTIYTGSQQATTNDFGVLSLAVGDASTFANADTGKMPFFISVSVDGTLIGRSQILNVPVAEVANRVKSSFTKEDLVGTWSFTETIGDGSESEFAYIYYVFNPDGTLERIDQGSDYYMVFHYNYVVDGNNIYYYPQEISRYFGDGLCSMRWINKNLIFDSVVGGLTKK